MLELPEVVTLTKQASETLVGKKIAHVFNASKPHKFTFYIGDPLEYGGHLVGKTIESAKGYGMFVDFFLTGGTILSIGDGVIAKYNEPGNNIPENYQLILGFEDESFLVFTVAMYGFISVYPDGVIENKYHELSMNSISPLDDTYTMDNFNQLFAEAKKTLSAKAILATEQRIPGVGNGVLQDILFNARIHPKRKALTLSDEERATLFRSLKDTLKDMTEKGGRNTQSDLYGNSGRYITVLSANTWKKQPCPACGGSIMKESYMGGSIYFCPNCQK
ncbi:endonuclease VIII [Bacteroides sp. 51]|uniref:endonuclease VIII n=1 Tax=Bacteroides sp. 51 TaxID=2302938 RepID=UPI0013D627A2|nr:endonuclease VIII [Bacteroides sp. 51]NDV81984.1 endonuclease VIII [Bacteroides sp. 51]